MKKAHDFISFEERSGITPDFIKEHFVYDDGKLIRVKCSKGSRCKFGFWEWTYSGCGRRKITIKGKTYLVHRLIWILHNGYIPVGMEIDHINRNPLDNKIENLRMDCGIKNRMNRSDNSSGHVGVHWSSKNSNWVAQIQISGVKYYLGSFEKIEDAIEARKMAESRFGLRDKNLKEIVYAIAG